MQTSDILVLLLLAVFCSAQTYGPIVNVLVNSAGLLTGIIPDIVNRRGLFLAGNVIYMVNLDNTAVISNVSIPNASSIGAGFVDINNNFYVFSTVNNVVNINTINLNTMTINQTSTTQFSVIPECAAFDRISRNVVLNFPLSSGISILSMNVDTKAISYLSKNYTGSGNNPGFSCYYDATNRVSYFVYLGSTLAGLVLDMTQNPPFISRTFSTSFSATNVNVMYGYPYNLYITMYSVTSPFQVLRLQFINNSMTNAAFGLTNNAQVRGLVVDSATYAPFFFPTDHTLLIPSYNFTDQYTTKDIVDHNGVTLNFVGNAFTDYTSDGYNHLYTTDSNGNILEISGSGATPGPCTLSPTATITPTPNPTSGTATNLGALAYFVTTMISLILVL
jgi:hypothetical protein